MNVNDVERYEVQTGDRLSAIFARQKELLERYEPIERENGLLHAERPLDLHDRRSQARLKDAAWRVTEEVAEAVEAYMAGDEDHAREEVADAFHFLVELAILSETPDVPTLDDLFDGEFRERGEDEVMIAAADLMTRLGIAMNCLKNKPWKQTHMLTDVARYQGNVVNTFHAAVRLAKSMGMDEGSFFDMYFRKSEVNRFRQRSAY